MDLTTKILAVFCFITLFIVLNMGDNMLEHAARSKAFEDCRALHYKISVCKAALDDK